MDYSKMLDDTMLAFIAKTNSHYDEDANTLTDQRAQYTAMCRAMRPNRPDGVTSTDSEIAGVLTRTYVPQNPSQGLIIYMHGGGFILGGLDSHDDTCVGLCAALNLRVIAIDYRLAPEHRHPAQVDDCYAVLTEVAQNTADNIVLIGDSAGGTLCAALCHKSRDEQGPKIAGQILIYPALGGDTTRGSFVTHANAPLLKTADMAKYSAARADGSPPIDDPTYYPLLDTNFADLPPTFVASAECDPLCDDGRDYVDAITAANGRAIWICEQGLVHGHLRARHTAPRATSAFDRVVGAATLLVDNIWPY